MKTAPPGVYFAKRKNYKRVVILAYKFDRKMQILISLLLDNLAARLTLSKEDRVGKVYLENRLQSLNDGFKRLKRACPQYSLDEL